MKTRADDFADQVSGIAALNESVRRDLYLYVSGQPTEVSRDEAAAACAISRALAAFHLDKLVDEELLEPTYRRLSGRTGPGAGRPTKLYRRSSRQVSVNLPPRSYELAAKLFAGALDGPQDAPERARLSAIAHRFGETVGAQRTAPTGTNAESEDSLDSIMPALGALGYEPYRDGRGDVRMRNCPFHTLATEHRELVCGMNLQLMGGVVAGLGVRGVRAALEPRLGECCVAIRRNQPDCEVH
jgi:predicted ArsR family transcriptional regulator